MSEQSRTILKSYFETNDVPTEAQFIDLIDSSLNKTDDPMLYGGISNITAYAGGGQANAVELVNRFNRVLNVATPGDSVKLNVTVTGRFWGIYNFSANACDLFPANGGYINALAQDTAISIPAGYKALVCCYATNYTFVILVA